jgi:hydroxymethylpyrimidine/phosphomethylpyrimidine kinase
VDKGFPLEIARFRYGTAQNVAQTQQSDPSNMPQKPIASVLSIAGSDSSGGAGVQMDLKTFAACGVHGLSAITAVTAQSTSRVFASHAVPTRQLEQQLRAVLDDFPIAAIKIGMLATASNAHLVARVLRDRRARNVVLDPVLASSSGTPLLSARGLRILRKELIPDVDLLTPNLPEATILLGRRVPDPVKAALALRDLGARAVLLKGGHGRGRMIRDVLATTDGTVEFAHPRCREGARGTGCALSSAIAAGLARGSNLHEAIAAGEDFVQSALTRSFRPGYGKMRLLATII